jgi:hypothetical protein
MLVMAFGIFTLVAAMGAGMALELCKGRKTEKGYALLHAGFALGGSALVIVAALDGDTRLYANIGMAVVIIALGAMVSLKRAKGGVPKSLALAHAGLAVACYLLLAYNAFVPAA